MVIHANNLERQQEVVKGIKRDRDRIQTRMSECRKQSEILAERADGLTRAVLDDDKKALKQKLAILDEKRETDLRASDLETELVSLDRRIEDEQRTIAQLQLYAAAESLSKNIKTTIPKLAERLSSIIAPVAELCSEFNAQFESAINQSLPLLANDDPARIRGLTNRLDTVVVRALRAEIAFGFQAVGLHVADSPGHLPTSFRGVIDPAVDDLIAAIRSGLPANDADGTFRFRCRTQISGLYGLFLREGEIVSLRPDDPQLAKVIEMGSLELIGEAKLAKGDAA